MTSLPMTTCANCGKDDGRDGISLKLCNGCRMVKYCNRECQLAHRSSHMIACRQQAVRLREDKLLCVFCRDEEPDENGNQVRSGVCACRGDSGCFHLSCLVKNAVAKFTEAINRQEVDLSKIWLECITCNQRWTGDTAADMGKECAAFICRKYPNNRDLKLLAFGIQFRGIALNVTISVEERRCAAEEMLSTFDECFRGEESIPAFALNEKFLAFRTLGNIAGERNGPEETMNYYEQALDCLCSLGCDENAVAMMQLRLAIAKAQCVLGGGDTAAIHETALPFIRAIFEKSKEEFGEDGYCTLSQGYVLANTLCALRQFDDAKDLIQDLCIKARRVLGANHYLTNDLKLLMNKCGIRE